MTKQPLLYGQLPAQLLAGVRNLTKEAATEGSPFRDERVAISLNPDYSRVLKEIN